MKLMHRLNRRRIVVFVAVLAIIAAGAFAIYRSTSNSGSLELEEDQQIVAVRRGDLVNEVSISGRIIFPYRENMAFGSKGVVAEVLVREGERVSKGDLIARLDTETVARLEREVAEAISSFRDARDELEDLVSPPDLDVAEARRAVALAEDVLRDANDSLGEILNPTDLQMSDMEAQVAAAGRTLREAEDALREEMERPTALQTARAALNVLEAERSLADLQEPPSSLEVAYAFDRVARAEGVLRDSMETLESYEAGVNDEDISWDLADARHELDTAESSLSNAQSNYEVARREWDARLEDTEEALGMARQAYVKVFEKWLGIAESPDSIDFDYRVALSDYGVDLEALFSKPYPGTRLTFDLSVPSDNSDTAWNEALVFVWRHFSRQELLPTCDTGELPAQVGLCIEEEFRSAGSAYRDAIDAKEKAEADARNALASSQALVASSILAIRNIQDRIGDLTQPLDPVVHAQLESAVRVAEGELADARLDLSDLTDPADEMEITLNSHEIDVAQATLADARRRLHELREFEDRAAVADLTAKVELARANLEDLKLQQAEALSGEDRPDYPSAFHAVAVAKQSLAQRRRDLDDLLNGPDPADLNLLTARVESAQTLLNQSRKRLTDATGLRAPSDGFISRVNFEEGSNVEANDAVAILVDTGVVEVDGAIDEIDVLSVELAMEAEVMIDALPDQTMLGKVSFVGVEAVENRATVSYQVRIEIELPPDMKVPEGLSAIATIILSHERDVLLIPVNAIRGSFDDPFVQLVLDGEPVEMPVSLGSSDDFWIVVSDGLDEGDMVVAIAPEGQDVEFFTEDE